MIRCTNPVHNPYNITQHSLIIPKYEEIIQQTQLVRMLKSTHTYYKASTYKFAKHYGISLKLSDIMYQDCDFSDHDFLVFKVVRIGLYYIHENRKKK
jgi:hypothetical protein